jgi:predicted AAA+ superfamily ATPase
MRRFWTMLAHSHGQTWNASSLGRALSLSVVPLWEIGSLRERIGSL